MKNSLSSSLTFEAKKIFRLDKKKTQKKRNEIEWKRIRNQAKDQS
jgi:hypothetical protein